MKDKETEIDINDVCVAIDVDVDLIEKAKDKEITSISLDITENNYLLFLDNIQGNLILVVDEAPTTFHSCYFWNKGEFPYSIKNTLKFLLLSSEEEKILVKITSVNKEVGQRFDFTTGNDNPQGESCVWNLIFNIEPCEEPHIKREHKTYIMRWNPGISSSKIKDYCEAMDKWPNGFNGNWSIYEWQDASEGDRYYMVRVGEGPNGIVYDGHFRSNPYEGEDWSGKGYKRHYVDITIEHPCHPDNPCVTIEQLEELLPEICWRKGHSGELITKEQAEKLEILFQKKH